MTFKPELKEEDFIVKIRKTVRGEGGLQSLQDADVIISGVAEPLPTTYNWLKS